MRTRRFAFVPALALLLASCAQIKESDTRLTEDHLLTAGFKIMLADTSERQAMLNDLAPETVTRIPRPEGVFYIYADPDLCSCLYVGRQQEFDELQKLAVERQISDQQMFANELQQDQSLGWGPTGPWGNAWMGGNNAGRPNWDPN